MSPQHFHKSSETQNPTAQQAEFTPQLEQQLVEGSKIKFAYNATGKNKDWDFKKLAANFRDVEGTINNVLSHVKAGHALCAGLLGGSWRSKSNVVGSQWLLLDIDNSQIWVDKFGNPLDENGNPLKIDKAWVDIDGNVIEKSDGRLAHKIYKPELTLDEALEHPFIKEHCALIYTTASHKPNWHKFRLVFVLPEFVLGADTVEVLTRYLMKHLPHDPACKDASRVFYGNTEATFPLIQPNVTLPQSWIDEAITTAHQEKIEYEKRIAEITARRLQFQERAETNNWDIDQLIQQALSYIPERSPGSNNYNECLQVLMALNAHYGAVDAEIIAEQWSPSIKGTTWNIRAKFKSFRGRTGISIGTLFHIAKQYGFRFPVVERETFNSDGIITRRQWQATHGVQQSVKDFIQTLTTVANKAKQFIGNVVYQPEAGQNIPGQNIPGAGIPGQTIPGTDIPGQTIPGTGIPGQTAPAPTNNLDVDIWFKPENRAQTYIDAANSGKKYILDISHAGAGKSHITGEFTPELFAVETLFYISNEHRNPTVATVEEWTDLPVRHNGLVADSSKLTPLGNPHTHWPQPGEEPNIEGTCNRTPLFHVLAAKGYQSETSTEASLNPICNTCKLRVNCAGTDSAGNSLSRIKGATFRRDRRNALASNRIRANINSLPQPKDIAETQAIAFVDEFSRQVQPLDETEANLQDYDRALMEVQTKLPELYDKVRDLVLPLRALLTGKIPITQETYYGYSDELVREFLGEIPKNLPELIAELESIQPNIEELVQEADSVSLDNVEGERKSVNRGTLKFIRSHLNKQATLETHRNIDNLPVNWLIPLLKVIAGVTPGALRVKGKRLIIATKNTRHADVLKAFDLTFLMDATATRENVAMHLGINPDEILVISEVQPDYSNLTIHQITGFGLLGKDRSEKVKNRQAAFRDNRTKHHNGSIAYIDHLSEKNEGDGHWFVDNRGSNTYQELEAICSFGTPYQDVGSSQQVYITLTGDRNVGKDSPKFQSVVDHQVQSEVIQNAGRLRANRRPEETLTYYVVSDKDLSYLLDHYKGAKFIKSDAFEVCPEAGDALQQTRWGLVQGFKQLIDQGTKVTQAALAETCGISQEYISKIAKQFGGWKSFKKLLLLLYDSLYRTSNNFSAVLTSEEQWLINEYLPLLKQDTEAGNESAELVIEHLLTFSEHLGWQGFTRAVNAATIEIKAFLMNCLISVLPREIHYELRRSLISTS